MVTQWGSSVISLTISHFIPGSTLISRMLEAFENSWENLFMKEELNLQILFKPRIFRKTSWLWCWRTPSSILTRWSSMNATPSWSQPTLQLPWLSPMLFSIFASTLRLRQGSEMLLIRKYSKGRRHKISPLSSGESYSHTMACRNATTFSIAFWRHWELILQLEWLRLTVSQRRSR